MKHSVLMAVVLFTLPSLVFAQKETYQHGMVIRMRMTDCLSSQRGVMAALAGNAAMQTGEECPEYTLMTDHIVYVISGRVSGQIIPLAESTDFRFKRNELLVRVDDARRETHFMVKEMILRLEWERIQQCQPAGDGLPLQSSFRLANPHPWR